jgi:hypothetical protein
MELCWSLVLLSIVTQLFTESNKRFFTRSAVAEISFSDIGFDLSGEVNFHRYSSGCRFSKTSCGSVASAELLVPSGRSCGNIKLNPSSCQSFLQPLSLCYKELSGHNLQYFFGGVLEHRHIPLQNVWSFISQ